ncbi:MAG: formate dehydrogenase accessory sulfurtransferase FdhD, partial [Nocardioides sp.]
AQKAVAAGVGALVSVGAPSSLTVRLAQETGLRVYGFTSPKRCVSYTS